MILLKGKRKLVRMLNFSYRYINDLISLNSKSFKELISDIYPKELTISETTESTSVASYLDLLFTGYENNKITTKLYDKRDAFGFHIVNFPFAAGKHSLKRGKVYAIEKITITGQYKSLSAGRSCGKIDARVFEQFSDLQSLSSSHSQLGIINNN